MLCTFKNQRAKSCAEMVTRFGNSCVGLNSTTYDIVHGIQTFFGSLFQLSKLGSWAIVWVDQYENNLLLSLCPRKRSSDFGVELRPLSEERYRKNWKNAPAHSNYYFGQFRQFQRCLKHLICNHFQLGAIYLSCNFSAWFITMLQALTAGSVFPHLCTACWKWSWKLQFDIPGQTHLYIFFC